MFKRSRRKIVAALLSVLVVLLFGTLCIIYLASYREMTRENRAVLRQYVEAYALRDGREEEIPVSEAEDGAQMEQDGQGRPLEPPVLELSTVYSVAVSDAGEVLAVDTADVSTLDEEALTQLALEIIAAGTGEGSEGRLLYRMADKGEYILVAFLDNTVMAQSARTLINYTLIFGSITLVLLFFLARFLAGRIVSPLEESYRHQRQFISDAGHELKTPVAVVGANAELLAREIGENQWLSNIQYETGRMSALILQLLELARTENVQPPMEPVDLSRLVCGEALPFESVAFEQGLRLETDLGEGVQVMGNGVQLKQLTAILLDNAIRHSQGGERVAVSLGTERGWAVLSVVNAGPPIPPEQRRQLFERFYRSDDARSGEGGHYGLGLAIAKAIAEAHRGSIEVACRDGTVEFRVKLPLTGRGRRD